MIKIHLNGSNTEVNMHDLRPAWKLKLTVLFSLDQQLVIQFTLHNFPNLYSNLVTFSARKRGSPRPESISTMPVMSSGFGE